MTAMLSISGLYKSYRNKQVLKDVNLTLKAGQILGVVGPNGAGKTTCLQALLGLTMYEGDVDVLGFNPRKNRKKMLEEVAYIADVAVLPKWIKVNQVLTYMQGVHPNFDRHKAEMFLAKTNIPATAKVKTLSKGMVTQLHLAIILAVDAKILILDEPTLGLDILTRRQFYTHLLEDFYADDKCIIVTTHQIEEIEHILTDVAFIREGQIVLTQSVDDMRNRFKLLAVDNEHLDQASSLNPIMTNSMMGITSMLFDSADPVKLNTLGNVSSATLADIFVGVMTQETKL
ncbi:ABC transporter ATP-binding protein [uncultured Paraglaciecola sp.]|uniref:ABC transporter ATP-binding protein n=1 Tax=uncultured Paraglaciecola sp. TaxID=1765024 RepID=UPI00261C5E36|nr:ABC transporter ATP-binding protein [uncultured Paraglaciecola sp.]